MSDSVVDIDVLRVPMALLGGDQGSSTIKASSRIVGKPCSKSWLCRLSGRVGKRRCVEDVTIHGSWFLSYSYSSRPRDCCHCCCGRRSSSVSSPISASTISPVSFLRNSCGCSSKVVPSEEPRLGPPLHLLGTVVVLRRSPVELSFFDASELCTSRKTGRRIGMHWTIMVPVTSDEYHT